MATTKVFSLRRLVVLLYLTICFEEVDDSLLFTSCPSIRIERNSLYCYWLTPSCTFASFHGPRTRRRCRAFLKKSRKKEKKQKKKEERRKKKTILVSPFTFFTFYFSFHKFSFLLSTLTCFLTSLLTHFISLLPCGDIEPNPGPNYRYPCTMCKKPVKSNQKGIECSNCSLWTHSHCAGVSDGTYLTISDDTTWFCPSCTLNELPFPNEWPSPSQICLSPPPLRTHPTQQTRLPQTQSLPLIYHISGLSPHPLPS